MMNRAILLATDINETLHNQVTGSEGPPDAFMTESAREKSQNLWKLYELYRNSNPIIRFSDTMFDSLFRGM